MGSLLLFFQLAFGLAIVLAPGFLVARAIGVRGMSATLAWSLAVVFLALGVAFVLRTGLWLSVLVLFGVAGWALPPAARRPWPPPVHGLGAVALGAFLLGIALWPIAGAIGGDGHFHLGRVQKLVALGDLSPWRVGEFLDAGLHPGYAFPLWHGFVALVAKVSFADPADAVLHLPTFLLPITAVVTFEAARLVFRRSGPAAVATAAGIAIVGMAPSYGGALTALALPATSSRQILVPATVALALEVMRNPTRATVASAAAASFALAVVHPSYAIFVWIPFAGFVAVRYFWERRDGRRGVWALAAIGAPVVVVALALVPVIRSTASVAPSAQERLRGWKQYEGQLNGTPDLFAVAPELFSRAGAVAVAALLLVPLTVFASRRRWAAFVVGGSLAVFLVTLLPFIFTPFSDLVSLSQSRRLAGFLPFGIALAGGMGVVASRLKLAAIPVGLLAGIVFQLLYPGDFGYALTDGGPSWVTWIAVVGCLVALAYGFQRLQPLGSSAVLAAAALMLPTYIHGFGNWSDSPNRRPSILSEGLVSALRERAAPGEAVYADPEASYRIGSALPLYVCLNPPGHVADTEQNRPRERVAEFREFARTGALRIPRECGATWLVVDKSRFDPPLDLQSAYDDTRWSLYRL